MIAITVVIPVYNVEKHLVKCIQSVLKQTFKDYEIILVDDGSTDESGKICDEYVQKYPFVSVIHQENKGLGGARNTGIKAAKGEYILFLDSDDYIDAELLEICYSKVKKYDCDMVLFDLIAVYDDGTKGVKYTCKSVSQNDLISNDEIKSLLFVSSACNRLFRTTLFLDNEIEFPEKLWYEDLRTVTKLISRVKGVYYYNERPLYYYYQRSGSIMHTPDFNRIVNERIDAVKEVWQYYSQNDLLLKYKEELEFIWIFHGFFLPVREMQKMTFGFNEYADILNENLGKYVREPLKNKYVCNLNRKEKKLLEWAWNRNYGTIKLFSFANKLIKKVRNVKKVKKA